MFMLMRAGGLLFFLLVCQAAVGKEQTWYRYENPYFVAHSNANEKKARAVLEGLEKFRTAVSQVANIKVPESAQKTQVLIFRSNRDFQQINAGDNIDAFVKGFPDGQIYVVMYASADKSRGLRVVRHEYVHVLLAYSKIRFPKWFNEGFAELASTLEFRKRDTTFVFGEAPPGVVWTSGKVFDWNNLISEGWINPALQSRKVHAAYVQSWLLTHFVMLGDNFGNMPKLHHYLGLLAAGEPSLPAFEKAFGMDGNQLWSERLREYSRNIYALVYDFNPDGLRLDFERSEADPAVVESLIEKLKAPDPAQ